MASAANLTAPDSIKDMWNTFFFFSLFFKKKHNNVSYRVRESVKHFSTLLSGFCFDFDLTQPGEFISMSSSVFKHAGLALINSAESLPGCG